MTLVDDGFLRRAKVTVPAAQVGSGGASNYTVVVNEDVIGASHDFWSEVQADGGDIRVSTDQAGATRLALDVIAIDTSGKTIQLAIQPQSLSSSSANEFWLWWDHDSTQTQPAASNTYGSDNAYHSSLVGYWPLQEDPSGSAPQMLDRTSNGNDGTSSGSMTGGDSVAGKIGNALDFDGGDDYVSLPSMSYGSDFSVAAWIKPTDTTGAEIILSKRPSASFDSVQFFISGTSLIGRAFSANDVWMGRSASSQIAAAWQQVVMTFSGGGPAVKLYRNGSQVDNADDNNNSFTTFNDLSVASEIGSQSTGATNFQGTIDELRIHSAELSQAYITTLYNNTNAPGTFASLGSAENVAGGGVNKSTCGVSLGL